MRALRHSLVPPLGLVHASLGGPPFWRTVGGIVLVGPMVGGAPWVWTIIGIPFAYVLRFYPALLGGVIYALWFHAPARREFPWYARAVVGGVIGAAACIIVAFVFVAIAGGIARDHDLYMACTLLAPHGLLAGAVLAGVGHSRQ